MLVYTNAGRLFHPLDVATFRPQEEGWKRAVLERHRQNSDIIMQEMICSSPWMEL